MFGLPLTVIGAIVLVVIIFIAAILVYRKHQAKLDAVIVTVQDTADSLHAKVDELKDHVTATADATTAAVAAATTPAEEQGS